MLIQNTSNTVQVAQPPISYGTPTVAYSNPNPVVNSNNSATQVPTSTVQEPTTAQLNGAVNSLNQVMLQSNISLAFSVDSSTHTPVVKVTDSANGEVVAQFPSKATLAIAQAIDQFEKRQGMLLNQKA